jgi:uncharacterized delta-60 repeat protein
MNATRFRFARCLSAAAITTLLLFIVSHSAHASPGDVDPSFALAGKAVNGLTQLSETLALGIQADGKIIAVGNMGNSQRSFLVTRYNVDGSLDTSFGNGGNVITSFSAGASSANAVAIQADGKIVVAGYAGDLFAIARYNPDGTLDSSFGSAGLITGRFETAHLTVVPPASSNFNQVLIDQLNTSQTTTPAPSAVNVPTVSLASSVAIQSDGKIVIAGDSFALNPQARDYALDCNFGIARYNSDGSLDETFGFSGIVLADFGSFDRAHALAIQSDGKIVVAGDSNSTGTGPYSMIVARYNSDGTLDSMFGSGGKAIPVTGSFEVSALALQPDAKIILAGTYSSAYPAYADFALARYNSDGTLDATFGSGGTSVTDFAWTNSYSHDNRAFALALQPDGKILLGGYSSSTFALARYHMDGSSDASFGNGGIAITQVSAIGSSTINFPISGSTSSFGLSASSSFFWIDVICCVSVPAGVKLDLLRVEQAFALAVQSSGKIVAGGVVDGHAALVRYHSLTTPKLSVANVGMPLPHGDFITPAPPNKGAITFNTYVGDIPQSGIGGIVSLDSAISCGTRCSAAYDAGRTVILNAVWPAGSYFVGWDGCAPVSGGGCAITMNQDAVILAKFEPDLPITLDASILPDGEMGLGYDTPSGIGGGRLPISAKVVSGKMPSGLSFNGRKLSGTPLSAGKSKFTVKFTDATGFTVTKTFNLNIYKPLNISNATLKSSRISKNYSGALKVSGGKAPYTWSILSGNLPDGLRIDESTGKITGVPTSAGTYSFTVRVTDSLGQQFDRNLTLTAN